MVAEPQGVVAGHARFHVPPDETGIIEVAYSVDPAYRRRGLAPVVATVLPALIIFRGFDRGLGR